MKIYYYTFALLICLSLSACTKDLGNYDYKEINELTINGVLQEYVMRTGIDTLHITPHVSTTIDDGHAADRYTYLWMLRQGNVLYDTIARTKDLSYPILLNPADHDLYYRILDKETGMTWVANSKIKVSTPYSRGLLIMGEDEEGYAEAEMLAMLADTVHIPHILSKSGLPRLREPRGLFHTGGSSNVRLWAMTRTGSYFLDRGTMSGTANNNLGRHVFASDALNPESLHPVVVAPQIRTAAGTTGSSLYRALITAGGDVFASAPVIMGGDFYNNPINRVASAPAVRIPAAPYLLYPINTMNSFMWYDTDRNRFMNFTGIGLSTASTVLVDGQNDIFPWNQPAGRTLIYAENTRNTDGTSTHGNSFAIMRDTDNTHRIYKFYANGANPGKRGAYVVSNIATDFGKADFYAFSSQRSVLFYAVENKLYAYDYNPGFEKIYTFPEINEQISMLKFDTQIDHLTNSLYIATYSTTTKGTLARYLVGLNPNTVELLPQENSRWTGLVKIKDINWRAVN